jgi:hypothetical protein
MAMNTSAVCTAVKGECASTKPLVSRQTSGNVSQTNTSKYASGVLTNMQACAVVTTTTNNQTNPNSKLAAKRSQLCCRILATATKKQPKTTQE